MARQIVVLDDGETWAENGDVLIVTDEAFQKLLNGYEPNDLDESDIVSSKEIA